MNLEERKVVEERLRRVYFLFAIGLIVSLIPAMVIAILLQKLKGLLSLFPEIFLFKDWFWIIVIVVFLVVFSYWISAFKLLNELRRLRKIKSRLA